MLVFEQRHPPSQEGQCFFPKNVSIAENAYCDVLSKHQLRPVIRASRAANTPQCWSQRCTLDCLCWRRRWNQRCAANTEQVAHEQQLIGCRVRCAFAINVKQRSKGAEIVGNDCRVSACVTDITPLLRRMNAVRSTQAEPHGRQRRQGNA